MKSCTDVGLALRFSTPKSLAHLVMDLSLVTVQQEGNFPKVSCEILCIGNFQEYSGHVQGTVRIEGGFKEKPLAGFMC